MFWTIVIGNKNNRFIFLSGCSNDAANFFTYSNVRYLVVVIEIKG